MDQKRFLSFLVVTFLIMWTFSLWNRPAPKPAQQNAKPAEKAAAEKADKAQVAAKEAEKANPEAPAVAPLEKVEPEWATLGSLDPNDPYRMLVTFTNVGAAVERIELNSPRYHDIEDQEDRSGYLGHLAAIDAPDGGGAQVRVVGRATPADKAGLKPGDIITKFNDTPIKTASNLRVALMDTTAGQEIKLTVKGNDKPLVATLVRRPLDVVRPEGKDPLSFLLTLEQLDNKKIADGENELPGLRLRTDNWLRLPQAKPNEVAFEYRLPQEGLIVIKRYTLTEVPKAEQDKPDAPFYHLSLQVEIQNASGEKHDVAYRLDGPTGLPTEGSWYTSKIGRNWGAAGLRDVVAGQLDGEQINPLLVACTAIVDNPKDHIWKEKPLAYVSVDAHYFASAILPEPKTRGDIAEALPIQAGLPPKEPNEKNKTNVSCRVISKLLPLAPKGEAAASVIDSYRLFAGPKVPTLLANSEYRLDGLIYYGWFGWVAEPMLAILHFFYSIVHNYGIAIIMLTVLVRLCMFPISRKQALNAQKMQELQPEIKKITEKYKGNMEARSKAQQELFKKHNYNPLAGCLPVFLQLPIFIGLYRSLAVDVELRQAPLISESVHWCSNLGAPDMFLYWKDWLWGVLSSPHGWLGPYLNLLPLVTIALFLWQQKMTMPPPTDEQSAMQQKIMKYMMIFMAVMFFKVPSGLCIYFIASSLWSIAERKLLPKTLPPTDDEAINVRSRPIGGPGTNGNGAKLGKNKQRGKK